MEQSIPAGAVLSRYRVVERIGAGGMGEVYKAYDTSLDRSVALKILPPELVSHEDRLQRFVLEAKAASGLSHPNIVTIHEIGSSTLESTDGEPSAPFHFIAMELVEGETLRKTIYRERRMLRPLLDYLAQAADGLAKAHAAGIIHRDLKPENIMVTEDGFAKILDFGLAKLIERNSPLSHDGDAPTAVRENTREGIVLGTLGYMSPEQVEAKPVDGRSDIFSFGCILYEAVTRKKPFTADSNVDLLHQILHDDPEPISDLSPEVPWELRRIVRRCLAKNPDKRYQSMKDLANELRDLVDDYDQLTPGSGARPLSDDSRQRKERPRSGLIAGVLLIAALLAAAAGILLYLRHHPQPPPQLLSQMSIKPLTSSGKAIRGAISPDGRYLAYVAYDRGRRALYLKQIASGSEVPVMAPSPTLRIVGLTFSRDGNYLYVTSGEAGSGVNTLSVVPTLGGAPRMLINDVDSAAALSSDETEAAFVRRISGRSEFHLVVATLEGAKERVISVRKGADFFTTEAPAWSPDGKWIAISGGSSAGGMRTTILLVSPDGKEQRDLVKGAWFETGGVAWLPDGSGLITTGLQSEGPIYQVWLFPFPDGEPRRITNDLSSYHYVSVSADGESLVTVAGDERLALWKLRDGTLTRLTAEGERNVPRGFQLLPDGSVVYQSLASGNLDIWRWTPDGNRRQLTTHPRADYEVAVSPDAEAIYFLTERNGASEFWKMDVNGAGQTFVAKLGADVQPSVSPDGRWLLFSMLSKVWRLPTAGGEREIVSEIEAFPPAYSPNGTMIAGYFRLAPLPAPMELAIMPADGGTPLRVGEIDPRAMPRRPVRWTPDGKAVAYVRIDEGVENIWGQPIEGGEPSRLTDFDGGYIGNFRWSRDGADLYVTRGAQLADMVMISNFR